MNREEFLNNLLAKPCINAFTCEPVLLKSNELGDKFYHVNVRKISGQSIAYENIQFVVLREDEPEEAVYFFETDLIAFENVQENIELRDRFFPAKIAMQAPTEQVVKIL